MSLTSHRTVAANAGVASTLVLAAIVLTYLLPKPVWSTIPVLALIVAAFYMYKSHDRNFAYGVAATSAALTPSAIGWWPAATPAIGAILLGIVSWRFYPISLRSWQFPIKAVSWAVLVVSGVALFSLLNGPSSGRGGGTLTWTQPAQPNVSIGLFAAGLLVASAFNAIFEEILWRSLLPERHRGRVSGALWALMVSAGFGLVHLHGTPGGWTGVGATFFFALAMIVLRNLSRGSIILCLAVHVCADIILLWRLYA